MVFWRYMTNHHPNCSGVHTLYGCVHFRIKWNLCQLFPWNVNTICFELQILNPRKQTWATIRCLIYWPTFELFIRYTHLNIEVFRSRLYNGDSQNRTRPCWINSSFALAGCIWLSFKQFFIEKPIKIIENSFFALLYRQGSTCGCTSVHGSPRTWFQNLR